MALVLSLVLALALSGAWAPLDAQVVAGTVRDAEGPVAGATVRLQGSGVTLRRTP